MRILAFDSSMRHLVRACRALSDETRLRILRVLMDQSCCVTEVVRALGISQTRASRNLMTLYDAGFLTQNRQGPWCLYSIDEGRGAGYSMDLIRVVGQALEGDETVSRDRQRLKDARSLLHRDQPSESR
jgi:ArsR family transcriptional regulator